jgi:hypothetical protein
MGKEIKMKILIALLFIPSILFADKIVGYEYIIPKTETKAISDSTLMTGAKTDKELYQVLARKDISTTMDNYAKDSKVYKVVVKETKDVRPNGITATFIQKEGTVPADLNYDSKKESEENRRKIIEQQKQEMIEEQAVQRAIDKGLIDK